MTVIHLYANHGPHINRFAKYHSDASAVTTGDCLGYPIMIKINMRFLGAASFKFYKASCIRLINNPLNSIQQRSMKMGRSSYVLALCSALMLFGSHAYSMEFYYYIQKETNEKVVIGDGEITNGDAEKFIKIIEGAYTDKNGYKKLILNSSGGKVAAALKLVEAMDKYKIYAIVPDNAICASACASIIYVSAPMHEVRGTGRLGFHTCSIKAGRQNIPSSFCNETITENAFAHGIAHASVNVWIDEEKPNELVWIGRDVACKFMLCRNIPPF